MEKNVPPTLCMVLKGYPRISETFIANEILLLESLGFHIHIMSMRHPRETFTHASVKNIKASVDYLPSTILNHLLTLGYHNLMLALKKPKVYLKAVKKAAVRWMRTRKSATIKHLLQAGYLVHKCLPGKNIIHFQAHFAHSPTSVALFSSLLSGIPFSFFAHAKDIYTSDQRQLKEKIDLARFVVTCTKYNRNYLSQLAGKSTTPIFCVYHGINLDYFSPKLNNIECKPPYKLLTVARMTEKKGLPTLYRALKILHDNGFQFRHTLIGDGDDREKILELISSLQLSDNCEWIGTRTHEEVLQHFNESDLFVLACEIARSGDRDGIPNVLVESLAMGVPALSTEVSAIPEILLNDKTGITVPPSRPDTMSDAIIRMLTDHDLRQRLITNGRQYVEEEFDNKIWVKKLGELFLSQNSLLQIHPTKPT